MRKSKYLNYLISLLFPPKKGWYRIIANQFAYYAKSTYVPYLPVHVTLEPTNLCDQKCTICETGLGILKRKKGSLTFDNFKKIIDKIHRHTNTLLFYYMGEPLLNKYAYDMIKYARSKNIFVSLCTNGNFVDPKKLIDSGVNEVNFQIGGTTNEINDIYRVSGDLNLILENLEKSIEYNKKMESKVDITLGFIVIKHNEHQIDDFLKLCKKYGIKENLISPNVRNAKQGIELLPMNEKYVIYDKDILSSGILKLKNKRQNSCPWIWNSCVITWEGDVIPCCRDVHANLPMGNIFKSDLKSIWNNKKYRNFRKTILKNQKKIKICEICESFGTPHLK